MTYVSVHHKLKAIWRGQSTPSKKYACMGLLARRSADCLDDADACDA